MQHQYSVRYENQNGTYISQRISTNSQFDKSFECLFKETTYAFRKSEGHPTFIFLSDWNKHMAHATCRRKCTR